jgi:hypothetical protein
MREAAETRSYAAALSVLVVTEWLYLDWASRAPQPLPNNFVHAEWGPPLHDRSSHPGERRVQIIIVGTVLVPSTE